MLLGLSITEGCDYLQALRKRLIHLHQTKGMSRKRIRQLIHLDRTLKEIYNWTPIQLSEAFAIPQQKAILLYNELQDENNDKILLEDMQNYQVITILDVNYPTALKTIPDAPLVLYALGNVRLLNEKTLLSVIGTRNPSPEARGKLEYIVKPLLDLDWTIVSGMAKGVDGFAHRFSLQEKRKTIAVLGGGFKHIYPKVHLSLFHEICEFGLVISEYPPHVAPEKYHFPERNRIISGLSFGTLVIEAMERSGTLITVEQALEQGKDVFAVPSSPLIPQGKGCHRLIQEGAKLVQNASDIYEDWHTQQQFNKI